MGLSVEIVDLYAKTAIDFWRLRPEKFYAEKKLNPSRYLSPYQFLFISFSIALAIYIASFSLTQSAIIETTGESVNSSPKALASRMLSFFFVMILLNALFFRAISRIWPIRGKGKFSSIFELQCYMQAILLPAMLIDILLGPLFTELIVKEIFPPWSILTLVATGFVIGICGAFFWNIPGIALINAVSKWRVWAGLFFWSTVILIFLGGIFITYENLSNA